MDTPLQHSLGKKGGRAWSLGVAGAYMVLVVLVLGFVGFALTQEVELVSADYYQRAIGHQDHIDSVKRAQALPAEVAWTATREGGQFAFAFPVHKIRGTLQGTIHLYRPDDFRRDREYAIALDANGRQLLPAADLEAGLWRAKIRWDHGAVGYYSELVLRVD